MNVIEVENLNFAYNGVLVLEEINFIVKQGEFIGIFGPNGGGKTTLLSLIMGFLKPTRGKIRIFERPPQQARDKLGWVPQNFHFDRHFPISVEEVVLGGRLAHLSWNGRFSKEEHKIAEEMLDKVGMLPFLKVPFATLSGGQAQRTLIARALASFPSLLLLDEPTASVDYAAQTEIFKLLTCLKGEMTIVMVTHDLNSAVGHVDSLFCVQKNIIPMSPEKVCEHFALGLYHAPLKKKQKAE
jgi:zinc transport system ATP-binding protein